MRKKLIEVALPLEVINAASSYEKQPGIGSHPRGLHLWWARRPLATARAVIFSQMVDDPSSCPEEFPTEEAQDKERQRLFRLIEELVKWENTTNEKVLQRARDEIWKSWRRTCKDNKDHPQADELFNPEKLPAFHDPFAGGGALPLEAQRLGLEAYASDLNPVAVLINKAMIEIPPKFANMPPVNPESRMKTVLIEKEWRGAEGLAADIKHYGQLIQKEVEKRILHLFPKVEITSEIIQNRPDLSDYQGENLTVLAWLWARTVKSPNPAFSKIDVPLISNYMLSTKKGKEAYIEPIIEENSYRLVVRSGKPTNLVEASKGTKLSRGANFKCIMSGQPISSNYIKAEGIANRLSTRLIAIIVKGKRGKIYISSNEKQELIAKSVTPTWKPDLAISGSTQYLGVKPYGIDTFYKLFSNRQLHGMNVIVEEIEKCCNKIKADVNKVLTESKSYVTYDNALKVYLSFALSRLADYNSAISVWKPSGEQVMQTFKRQAIQMTWDYAESNILSNKSICWKNAVKYTADNLVKTYSHSGLCGHVSLCDAKEQEISLAKIVATDPPYYDNVPYADLSDYFYVWLRRSLRNTIPDLFSTLAVPKYDELVAFSHLHSSKEAAQEFFLQGMTQAMLRVASQTHPAFPFTVFYAFKQVDDDRRDGVSSTGWEVFLDSLIRSGFEIHGTWPVRTESASRIRSLNSNALASSIVLVCRRRSSNSYTTTRRQFLLSLSSELPKALKYLQGSNIAPVDLAQAAIGPGISIFSRYSSVHDNKGTQLTVKEALGLINQVLDTVLSRQENDFDSKTRWAIAWFDHAGYQEGDFGIAETLSKAKSTSLERIAEVGIVESTGGKVRLLRPVELPEKWNASDSDVTTWEIVHHLIRFLETTGERSTAEQVRLLGSRAEEARELAYHLYTVCERKKRAAEAISYNALVQSWPEIMRLSREVSRPVNKQGDLFGSSGE